MSCVSGTEGFESLSLRNRKEKSLSAAQGLFAFNGGDSSSLEVTPVKSKNPGIAKAMPGLFFSDAGFPRQGSRASASNPCGSPEGSRAKQVIPVAPARDHERQRVIPVAPARDHERQRVIPVAPARDHERQRVIPVAPARDHERSE